MLKKTLIATAAIGVALLAAATVLPALAQSRGAASATAAASATQPATDASAKDKRDGAVDSGARQPGQEKDRRKAKGSDDDEHRGDDERDRSTGNDKDKGKDKEKSGD